MTIDGIRLITPEVAVEDGHMLHAAAPGEHPQRSRYTAVWVKQGSRWLLDSLREAVTPQPASNARLAELKWLLGDFAGRSLEGLRMIVTGTMSSDGNFLLREFYVTLPDGTRRRSSQRIGWDPLTGGLKSWTFQFRRRLRRRRLEAARRRLDRQQQRRFGRRQTDFAHDDLLENQRRRHDCLVGRRDGRRQIGTGYQAATQTCAAEGMSEPDEWQFGSFSIRFRNLSMISATCKPLLGTVDRCRIGWHLRRSLRGDGRAAGQKCAAIKSSRAPPGTKRWKVSTNGSRRKQIYDKSEIPQLRARMNELIGKLSARNWQIYLQDMQQKLALINSPAAYKAQANILYNMNVASDAYAAKLRTELPNLVTMTADQVKQTLVDLQQQENDTRADEAAFQQENAQEVAMIQAQNRQTAEANAAADAAGLGNYGGGPYTPRNPMPQYNPAPIITGIAWPW